MAKEAGSSGGTRLNKSNPNLKLDMSICKIQFL